MKSGCLRWTGYKWELAGLIERTGERFEVKGLKHVIPERLLLVKKIGSSELPMLLAEFDLEQMKAFFLNQSLSAIRR